MTLSQATILGLVQGLTEFLPVSSTAHLRIVPALLGWADAGAAFTAVLQLGTLAAVVGFFIRDLAAMATTAVRPRLWRTRDGQRLLQLIVGTVPIGIAGVLLRHAIEGRFRSLWVVATALVVVAVLMAWTEWRARRTRGLDDVTLRDAVLIGLAQALALIPGVSRSGITLTAALALGLRRDAAARFSFLLSIPAVAAAGVFELPKVLRDHGAAAPLILGVLVAFASGYGAIAWLLRFLRTRTTLPFVVYRIALGLALLGGLIRGYLAP